MTKKKKSNGMTRHERNEHLTNWYMINLCWAIAGILGLTAIYYGYRNVNTILAMQPLMWVLTGVFAAGAAVLFALGKTGVIKNGKQITMQSFSASARWLDFGWHCITSCGRLWKHAPAQYFGIPI